MRLTIRLASDDYRGEHQAPDKESGAPLSDLTRLYPEDVYGPMGYKYYTDGSRAERAVLDKAHWCRNKPHRMVTVYRAVPKEVTGETQDKGYLEVLRQQQQYVSDWHRVPDRPLKNIWDVDEYNDYLDAEIAKQEALPKPKRTTLKINPGDWVTLDRSYAVEHGRSNLRNQYSILTKRVRAGDLYTEGNGLDEWGWDP